LVNSKLQNEYQLWLTETTPRNKAVILYYVVERKIKGRIEVTERRGKGSKQLLDHLKEKRGYWKLKEESLDRTVWRTCCGMCHAPVVRL
jgi:hypothetical protein